MFRVNLIPYLSSKALLMLQRRHSGSESRILSRIFLLGGTLHFSVLLSGGLLTLFHPILIVTLRVF